MGERERIKRRTKSSIKEKEAESSQTTEGEIVDSTIAVEREDPRIAVVEPEVESTVEPEVVVEPEPILLPSWGDIKQTEWMYHIPTRPKDIEMWAEEWTDFLLEWCESEDIHVMTFSLFVSSMPFKDLIRKADAFRVIGDKLTEKEVGEWLEGKKRQLRVYWRYLEDWADIIYKWALDHGNRRLDVKSIVIQERFQSFSKLPERDLHIVMRMLVDRGLAEWIDEKLGAIKLNI